MKHTFKLLALLVGFVATFSSCDKADDLQYYVKGLKPGLVSSVSAVAALPTQAEDTVLTLTWDDPKLGTSASNQKFIIELDSSANFANPVKSDAIFGKFSKAYKAKELNAILLNWGFAFGTAHDVSIRLVSSYGNNNDLSYSSVTTVRMTPYKIPPKIPLPTTGKFFIVGGFAAPFDWKNGATNAPRGQFSRIDETTFGGIFNFQAAQSFLLYPDNIDDWDNKYGGVGAANNSNIPTGDDFKAKGSDLLGPATAGAYKVTIDFQFGKYTVVPSDIPEIEELYITGDATPDNWTPNPSAAQKLTKLNSVEFEITMAFVPSKLYKFLVKPTATEWHPQVGCSSATGGAIKYEPTNDAPTTPTPDVAGNYKIHINTYTGIMTVTKV